MTETQTEKSVNPIHTFEPITTQEEFDARIKSRLAREREKWEKESGTEDLKAQLEAKDTEVAELKKSYYLEDVRRAVVGEVASRGVTEPGRIERVLKLVDLEAIEAGEDGKPSQHHVLSQVDSVASDVPELVRPRGTGSGGSRQPVLKTEKPLTRDEVESMNPDEVNSNWDRVRAFLAGERG